MTIENYKIKDFLRKSPELISEYMVAFQYLKPIQTKKEVFHLKLKHVEFIKENIYSSEDNAILKVITKVQGIKLKEVFEMEILTFFGLFQSVKQQLEAIATAEEYRLAPNSVDVKWETVNGAKRMSVFGIYNTLDNLANGDILKYKKIMNLEYSEVFTVLCLKKEAAELQKEMSAIKTPK